MMDIAFVSTGTPKFDDYPDPSYGTSVQIWKLARELVTRGHEVTIYSATFGERREWRTDCGITIVEVPRPSLDSMVNGLFTKLLFSKRVSTLLERASPDVVYLRERSTAYFPARLSIPTIYTVISPDACEFFYEFSVDNHPLNRVLFHYKKYIEESVCKHSDATIVMNEDMNEYFSGRGMSSVHTVSIAIEPDRFGPVDSGNRANRILYVGRLDYNKRPDCLLDAYRRMDPAWELHFAGDGPLGDELRAVIDQKGLDEVTYHGWIDREHVIELMSSAEIFVLPSRFDNSPNVVLEAMCSGCAVLASDTRGASSMINDGRTGLLFDRESQSHLRRQLQRLIDDHSLRRSLGENAATYARENHNTETIADRYLSVYGSLR